MLACTLIVFIFSALQAAAKGVGGPSGTINALIAYRFLCGIGIGGEYPTGSVAAAEGSEDPGISKKSQQRLFVLGERSVFPDKQFGAHHGRSHEHYARFCLYHSLFCVPGTPLDIRVRSPQRSVAIDPWTGMRASLVSALLSTQDERAGELCQELDEAY